MHDGQAEVMASDARYLCALGGVNSGKTSLGCLWLVREIERNGGTGQYLIVAPTFAVVTSSTKDAWQKTVEGTQLEGTFHASKENPHYKLGTGGTVYFRSAESSFEGLKPLAALLDEGGDCSHDVWKRIMGRLTKNGGRCLLSTTPYLSYDWIPRLIVAEADKGSPLYFYRCFPSTANPTTDLVSVEEQKRTLPQWEYEMRYEGKFTKPFGLVYDFVSADGRSAFVDVPEAGLPEPVAYVGSIDWGGTDPTVCLAGFLDRFDVLWIFWERYKTNEDIVGTVERLKEWHDAFHKSTKTTVQTWWCDHRPECIRALTRNGLRAKPAKKGPDSIPLGISLVQARIRTGRLKIIKKQCPNIMAEAGLYRYPVVDGVAMGNKPLAGNDHTMDALRYMVLGLDRKDIKARGQQYITA